MTVRKRVTKTGFAWEFCITIQKKPRKQYRKGGFKTKAAAKEAEEQAILLHNSGKLNTNTILFRHLVDAYIEKAEKKYSRSTVEDYKRIINNHFQDLYTLKAKEITTPLAQNWLDKKAESVSVWVVEKLRKIGKAVFNYGIKREILTFNPFEKTDSIETPHVIHNRLEIDEAIRLLNKSIELYPEITGVIALGLFSGLRRGEILGLKWSDINFDKKTIDIQRQYTKFGISEYLKTKSSRRKILVCDTLIDILKWHKKQSEVLNEYVFWDKENILSLKKLRTEFKKLLKICGLADMRFHDTRGTFVDISLSAGVPMKLIQQSVGHAKITTTADIYTEILQSVKNNAAILFEKNLKDCERIVNI